MLLAFVLAPVVSMAALGDPLVPKCTPDTSTPPQCLWGFKELMALINNIIYFVLFGLAIPISAIMFAYAGVLMLTSGGSTEAVTKAKKIFTNVAIGLILAAISFLIVSALLATLGFDGSWIGFKEEV